MKVQCKNCGTVFNLNEKKIPKHKAKFRCRQCQEFVYLNVADDPPQSQSQDQTVEVNAPPQSQPKDQADANVPVEDQSKVQADATVPPTNQSTDQTNECPKCGFSLPPDAIECPSCNIVLEKYKSYIEKKQAEEMQNEDKAVEEK